MRLLPLILLLLTACHHAGEKKPKSAVPQPAFPAPPPPPPIQTKIRCFPALPIASGQNGIHYSSGRMFILFNTMKSFAAVSAAAMLFSTECIICQPVEIYNGHLLFARQLEIYYDSTVYHPQPFETGKPLRILPRIASSGQTAKKRPFQFSAGSGTIRYLKAACSDSDLNELVLQYPAGEAVFQRLVNGSFFEYDLNNDGIKEQYIFSLYNCSQELTLFQIQPP